MTTWAVTSPQWARRDARDVVLLGGAVTVALSAGAAAGLRPTLTLLGAAALGLIALVACYPVVGIYLLIVVTPLTAGIDRGTVVPLLRPNEVVTLVVAVALTVRWLIQLRSARDVTMRGDAVSAAIVAMAVASSVIPLIWLRLRGQSPTSDDLLYALVVWKLFVVYAIVRIVRPTNAQIMRCLQFSVGTAVLVAVIAMLQVLNVGTVVGFLKSYYTSNGNIGAITGARGSSTLGLPIAVADLAIYNLAIVVGMVWVRRRATPLLAVAALVLTAGVVSAGEFSGVIGLVVGVIAMCVVMRSARVLRYVLPATVLALPVLWPVISTRLAGFQSASGLPQSWSGRLYNLQNIFWPQLFAHHNFLLGVRPAARVLAPHRANGFVWIESGYTWLLWAGGIPLLLAYIWFTVAGVRAGMYAVRFASTAGRIAGVGAVVALCVTAVLMFFDPHVTYRGAADELFVLLALTLVAIRVSGGEHHD